MIILLPILWLVLWAVISVTVCAILGLPPAQALHTGGWIFLAGSCGLPLVGWLVWRGSRAFRQQR